MKHPLIYSLLVLIIILLLIDKCNRKPITNPDKPFKEELVKGTPIIRTDTIKVTVYGTKPAPDTVYLPSDTTFLPAPDDSIRHYTLSENDTSGGTVVQANVIGHLLDYQIDRTCFEKEYIRVDTLKQYYNMARRTLSVGVFSGTIVNHFTYGVSLSYQDKQRRGYMLNVDPISKGGFVTITFPIVK